jgi:transmembrane sensor
VKHGKRKKIDSRALEQASEWMSILEQNRVQDLPRFAFWMLRSPAHVSAFLHIVAFDVELGRFATRMSSDAVGTLTGRRRTRRAVLAAAAVALMAVDAGGALLYWQGADANRAIEYASEVGEHRQIRLRDGSTVHLNTASRLRVDYSTTARDVHLLAGEALFKVASDPKRPFRVHTGAAIVQAVGTQFNVDSHRDRLVVAVLDGEVRLQVKGLPARSTSGVSSLAAGQIAELRSSSGPHPHSVALSGKGVDRRSQWVEPILLKAKEWKAPRSSRDASQPRLE